MEVAEFWKWVGGIVAAIAATGLIVKVAINKRKSKNDVRVVNQTGNIVGGDIIGGDSIKRSK